MSADTRTGIIGRQSRIHGRISAFHDRSNKFLYQMWVRSTMSRSLKERHVIWVVDLFPFGKVFDRLDQQLIRIWYIDPACALSAFKNGMFLVLQLLPFERHLGAIHVIAFPVLSYHVEQRTGSFSHHIGIFQGKGSGLNGKWRSVSTC